MTSGAASVADVGVCSGLLTSRRADGNPMASNRVRVHLAVQASIRQVPGAERHGGAVAVAVRRRPAHVEAFGRLPAATTPRGAPDRGGAAPRARMPRVHVLSVNAVPSPLSARQKADVQPPMEPVSTPWTSHADERVRGSRQISVEETQDAGQSDELAKALRIGRLSLLEDPRHRGLRREDAVAGRYGTARPRRLIGLRTDRGQPVASARPRSGSAMPATQGARS